MSSNLRRVLSFTTALISSFAAIASAHTYVVDAAGGAGVDFTDIPPAVAVAVSGDVILVHPGNYSAFTLNRAVTVLGAPTATSTDVQISGVNSGARAAIASLHIRWLAVSDCATPVILDDIAIVPDFTSVQPRISVSNSQDVRLHDVQLPYAVFSAHGRDGLRATGSRVEVTQSTLFGGRGDDDDFGIGGDGGVGVRCELGSVVHVSLSEVGGGAGGDATYAGGPGFGGNGGFGIFVANGTKLLLDGITTNTIHGGDAGYGIDCFHDGSPANGLRVYQGGDARASSVTFIGGAFTCAPPNAPGTGGTVDFVTPIDPSLAVSGVATAGQPLVFTLNGTAADTARIVLGRQAVVTDLSNVFEDQLTNTLRVYDLGVLPASGGGQKSITVPSILPKGYLLVFQGRTLGTDGVTRLTQSVPVIVR